jgi:hypothetical protein
MFKEHEKENEKINQEIDKMHPDNIVGSMSKIVPELEH